MGAGAHPGRASSPSLCQLLLYAGSIFLRDAWTALRHRSANMNTLIALEHQHSISLSRPSRTVAVGRNDVYFEAAAVIVVLILLGRMLEARAHRAERRTPSAA